MGCYNYIVTRWVTGFGSPADFSYSTELGCGSRQKQIEQMHAVSRVTLANAKYVVVSQQRDSQQIKALEKAGWSVVEHYPGQATATRALVAKLLLKAPGQQSRAENILRPPGLVVLARQGSSSP
jgi:hypothetical protein